MENNDKRTKNKAKKRKEVDQGKNKKQKKIAKNKGNKTKKSTQAKEPQDFLVNSNNLESDLPKARVPQLQAFIKKINCYDQYFSKNKNNKNKTVLKTFIEDKFFLKVDDEENLNSILQKLQVSFSKNCNCDDKKFCQHKDPFGNYKIFSTTTFLQMVNILKKTIKLPMLFTKETKVLSNVQEASEELIKCLSNHINNNNTSPQTFNLNNNTFLNNSFPISNQDNSLSSSNNTSPVQIISTSSTNNQENSFSSLNNNSSFQIASSSPQNFNLNTNNNLSFSNISSPPINNQDKSLSSSNNTSPVQIITSSTNNQDNSFSSLNNNSSFQIASSSPQNFNLNTNNNLSFSNISSPPINNQDKSFSSSNNTSPVQIISTSSTNKQDNSFSSLNNNSSFQTASYPENFNLQNCSTSKFYWLNKFSEIVKIEISSILAYFTVSIDTDKKLEKAAAQIMKTLSFINNPQLFISSLFTTSFDNVEVNTLINCIKLITENKKEKTNNFNEIGEKKLINKAKKEPTTEVKKKSTKTIEFVRIKPILTNKNDRNLVILAKNFPIFNINDLGFKLNSEIKRNNVITKLLTEIYKLVYQNNLEKYKSLNEKENEQLNTKLPMNYLEGQHQCSVKESSIIQLLLASSISKSNNKPPTLLKQGLSRMVIPNEIFEGFSKIFTNFRNKDLNDTIRKVLREPFVKDEKKNNGKRWQKEYQNIWKQFKEEIEDKKLQIFSADLLSKINEWKEQFEQLKRGDEWE